MCWVVLHTVSFCQAEIGANETVHMASDSLRWSSLARCSVLTKRSVGPNWAGHGSQVAAVASGSAVVLQERPMRLVSRFCVIKKADVTEPARPGDKRGDISNTRISFTVTRSFIIWIADLLCSGMFSLSLLGVLLDVPVQRAVRMSRSPLMK